MHTQAKVSPLLPDHFTPTPDPKQYASRLALTLADPQLLPHSDPPQPPEGLPSSFRNPLQQGLAHSPDQLPANPDFRSSTHSCRKCPHLPEPRGPTHTAAVRTEGTQGWLSHCWQPGALKLFRALRGALPPESLSCPVPAFQQLLGPGARPCVEGSLLPSHGHPQDFVGYYF